MQASDLERRLRGALIDGMDIATLSDGTFYPDALDWGEVGLERWFLEELSIMQAAPLDETAHSGQGVRLLAACLIDPISDYAVAYGILGYCPQHARYFSARVALDFLLEARDAVEGLNTLTAILNEDCAAIFCTKLARSLNQAASDLCLVLANPDRAIADCGIAYRAFNRRSSLQNALAAAHQLLLSKRG